MLSTAELRNAFCVGRGFTIRVSWIGLEKRKDGEQHVVRNAVDTRLSGGRSNLSSVGAYMREERDMSREWESDDSCPSCGGRGSFLSQSLLKQALGLNDKCHSCNGTGKNESSGGSSVGSSCFPLSGIPGGGGSTGDGCGGSD